VDLGVQVVSKWDNMGGWLRSNNWCGCIYGPLMSSLCEKHRIDISQSVKEVKEIFTGYVEMICGCRIDDSGSGGFLCKAHQYYLRSTGMGRVRHYFPMFSSSAIRRDDALEEIKVLQWLIDKGGIYMKLTKDEALAKIKELEEYVKSVDKPKIEVGQIWRSVATGTKYLIFSCYSNPHYFKALVFDEDTNRISYTNFDPVGDGCELINNGNRYDHSQDYTPNALLRKLKEYLK
jgi:hypothetical protein